MAICRGIGRRGRGRVGRGLGGGRSRCVDKCSRIRRGRSRGGGGGSGLRCLVSRDMEMWIVVLTYGCWFIVAIGFLAYLENVVSNLQVLPV